MKITNTKNQIYTAFLFAGFWVLLVCVYKLIQVDSVAAVWKYIAGVTAVTATYIFVGKEKIIAFAGFCMLMVALNYLSESADTPVWLKVVGAVAALLQLGTLGNNNANTKTAE